MFRNSTIGKRIFAAGKWHLGLVTGLLLTSTMTIAQEDHSNHQTMDHSQHQAMDHSEHQMTPEQFAELREKIELYRGFTDEQIMESMSRMSNHGGMISDASVVGEVGILALAHGYQETGNAQWKAKFENIAAEYPVGYGLGMAMMGSDHIQSAIDGLEAAGAKTILVLRTETGDTNSLNDQWQYIFGRIDESSYLSVPRVESSAKIIWGPSPTAHPIMADIMLENAKALSEEPANEMVMIIGHGAMEPETNAIDLEILKGHAARIKENGGFADVKYWNVQDDLPAEKRAKNVEKIRGMIAEAQSAGQDVIVITNVLTQSGIMGRLKADVDGTGAKFSDTGLMQSPKFEDWIRAAVEENLPEG